jgi:hypothetical protein
MECSTQFTDNIRLMTCDSCAVMIARCNRGQAEPRPTLERSPSASHPSKPSQSQSVACRPCKKSTKKNRGPRSGTSIRSREDWASTFCLVSGEYGPKVTYKDYLRGDNVNIADIDNGWMRHLLVLGEVLRIPFWVPWIPTLLLRLMRRILQTECLSWMNREGTICLNLALRF